MVKTIRAEESVIMMDLSGRKQNFQSKSLRCLINMKTWGIKTMGMTPINNMMGIPTSPIIIIAIMIASIMRTHSISLTMILINKRLHLIHHMGVEETLIMSKMAIGGAEENLLAESEALPTMTMACNLQEAEAKLLTYQLHPSLISTITIMS
jgi:hypothetical protein